ncbi:GGDEF domain-containing protein [Flavobacterium ginsenosidimutans]|uniref:GGDEF domain-containing protein n=1 Tax=Flavobacterium ginsenosidimutans TaxID=687844 RepID=UPI003D997194
MKITIFEDAYKKFLSDLLPKLYYDIIIKCIVGGTFSFFIYKLFKLRIDIENFLDQQVSLRIYQVILAGIVLITITYIFLNRAFKRKVAKLKEITYTDEKTGLKSHRLLDEYLEGKINESKKSGKPLSVILIDIDDFKKFNESHTPTIGDRILSEVGKLLRDDTRITDQTFRRYETGDEFVVVSTDTNITQVKTPADRKREFIANHNFLIDNEVCKITVCCGLAQLKEDDTVKTLLDRADYAMRNIAKKNVNKNSTEHAS